MSSYIEKGVLMDMSECFSDLQEENNLLLTVTKNYTQDGKIYCMPMRIYMPICFMGEAISEDTKSIEDLAAYCQNSERSLMDPLGYDYLVRMFLYTYGNEIFTEDGVFLQENLSSFLSSINEIAKKTGATEDGSRGQSYLGYPIGQSTLKMKKSLCGDLGSVYFNDVLCAISFIGDYKDLNRVCTFKNMVDGRYVPLNDIFIPNGIVGINKNSKDTELAKDFVKYLFSEEVQLQHLGDGFPINDKALTAWSQEPYDKNPVLDGATTITKNGEEKLLTIEPATVEEKQQVIEEVRTLTNPVSIDTVCWDFILNGSIEYLKGEKTLEQATSEISQKVNLYLSE
jgi:ABC-type Fe3+ transport system substrate-binding protein